VRTNREEFNVDYFVHSLDTQSFQNLLESEESFDLDNEDLETYLERNWPLLAE